MYGGTKSELERLVADAEKLTGQALDPNKFSDVITAIHAVQENLDITGTTALEAATTIEGSVNMMKAAWSNWLAGLGNENADMGKLTDNLIQSIGTVAENVFPAVQRIGDAIVENLPGVLSGLAEALGPVLNEALVAAWNLAVQALAGLGIQLPTIDTATIQAAFDGLSSAIQTLKDNADWLVPSLAAVLGGIEAFHAASAIVSVVQGIQTAFTAWRAATEGMTIAQAVLNTVMNANPFVLIATVIGTVVAAFVTLMATNENFRNAVINAWNQISETAQSVWGAIAEFFTATIPNAIQTMLDWFSQLPSRIASFLANVISNVASWAGNMAARAAETGSRFLSSISSFFSQLPSRVAGFLSNVISNVASWASEMVGKAQQAASDFRDKLISGLHSIIGKVTEVGRNIIQGLWNGISEKLTWVKNKIQGAVSEIKGVFTGIKGFFTGSPSRWSKKVGVWVMQGLGNGIDKDSTAQNAAEYAVSSIKDIFVSGVKNTERQVLAVADQLNNKLVAKEEELTKKLEDTGLDEATKETLTSQLNAVKEFRSEYENALSDVQNAQKSMADKLRDYGDLFTTVKSGTREFMQLGDLEKDIEAINRYGEALENLKARGVSDSLLDEITSLGVDEATEYTEKLLAMTDGQYEEYMALWEQKQQAAQQVAAQFYQSEIDTLGREFVDKIPEELGEVKDEMRDIGVQGIKGMVDGMYSQSGFLYQAAASIVSRAISAMRAAADIHSPSRKTAELVGVPFAQGIGVGFEKAYPGVMERMRTAFDASMAQTSARLQSAAGGHGSSVTREVNNNTTTVDRILRIEVTGEDGEFVRWLRNKIKTEDNRVGTALA